MTNREVQDLGRKAAEQAQAAAAAVRQARLTAAEVAEAAAELELAAIGQAAGNLAAECDANPTVPGYANPFYEDGNDLPKRLEERAVGLREEIGCAANA